MNIVGKTQPEIVIFKQFFFVVYFGNMVGGMLVAAGLVYSGQYNMFDGGMAVSVFSTAVTKCTMTFSEAFIKGIFCNILVSLYK